MALKPCRECTKLVSTSAKACPHCGVSQPTKSALTKQIGCLPVIGICFCAFVVLMIVGGYRSASDPNQRPPSAKPALDVFRPMVTESDAIICPLEVFQMALIDKRADHGPEALADMYRSVLHRSEKVKAMGCEEWREGIKIYDPKKYYDDGTMVTFSTSPNDYRRYIAPPIFFKNP